MDINYIYLRISGAHGAIYLPWGQSLLAESTEGIVSALFLLLRK